MEYISVKEYAAQQDLSERTVRNYCAVGRIEGAILVGKTWSIPAGSVIQDKKQRKIKFPLLQVLLEQKDMR